MATARESASVAQPFGAFPRSETQLRKTVSHEVRTSKNVRNPTRRAGFASEMGPTLTNPTHETLLGVYHSNTNHSVAPSGVRGAPTTMLRAVTLFREAPLFVRESLWVRQQASLTAKAISQLKTHTEKRSAARTPTLYADTRIRPASVLFHCVH